MSDVGPLRARALLKDGTEITLKDNEVSKVLYGLARLEQTALGAHLQIARVENAKGQALWPASECGSQ